MNKVVSALQMVVAEALMVTEDETKLTFICITLETAGPVTEHWADGLRVQDTTSPSERVEVVNWGSFVPALLPFTCHWYAGVVPALEVCAVKTTGWPAQEGLAEAVMVMDGGGVAELAGGNQFIA